MTNVIESLNTEVSKYTSYQLPEFPWAPLAIIILTAVVGVIYCFFGYKAIRALATIAGAVIGLAVGEIVVNAAKLQSPWDIVIPIIGAVVFGILGFFLYRVGVFIVVFAAAFAVTMSLLLTYTKLDETVVMIVSLVVGLILAVLAVVYLRPIVIILTGISGGMMVSIQLFENLIKIRWSPQVETITRLAVGGALAIAGIIYQFKTTKPRED